MALRQIHDIVSPGRCKYRIEHFHLAGDLVQALVAEHEAVLTDGAERVDRVVGCWVPAAGTAAAEIDLFARLKRPA